ncbi:ribosome maturation factor RimP [Actinomycetospora chibensis]|uniref:Ribosome maturation factor RimP n=1 Tax=Actinomycetospora chibensis TaxID=663606 RepID=A0ABV9RRU6_9PSEU|nr:ribosome maturation factor RimP [Actinomycetospora chibensis]MDD7924394.1 ribosome maturation factor RimP [Actinomycetospora chibensis]
MSPGTSPAQAAERLRPAVVDVVEAAGFVLDDLEVRPAGRRQVVRVVVDTAEVPGPHDPPAPGPDLDAVAGVSRELSRVLDESESSGTIEAPEGEYTLEVTTPGTDRPLVRPHHWRRAWLRRVAVTRTDGGTLTARVGPVDGTDGEDPGDVATGTVTLAEGTPRGPVLHRLPLAEVRQAVVEVEFKPAPSSEVDALVAAALEQGSGKGAETHGQGGRP